tara:strand:- start:98 stop:868 length:771 start_codon:yes stop_codon:yes gene_type:complete
MPKIDIDYSNTLFYKISCKDTHITDTYVGHTTNFVQRKHSHKQTCKNEKATNHKCKLYCTIRSTGGWDNWQMEIIAFRNCIDSYDARKKEQEYYETLKATLNSIEPFPKPKIKQPVAKIVKEPIVIEQPIAFKYYCDKCHFFTCKKNDLLRHNLTQKHIHNSLATSSNKATEKNLICEFCDKIYKDRTGLWRHKKKCQIEITTEDDDANKSKPTNNDELINYLIQENQEIKKENQEIKKANQEFKNLILEIVKKDT